MKNPKSEIRNPKVKDSTIFNRNGVAALMAVFVLILFSLLGLVICPLFSTQSAGKVNFLASQQALQIAEAGRQYAVWYLTTQDNLWITAETSEKQLGSGTYTLEVYDDEVDDEKIVISRGYVPQKDNYRSMRVVKIKGSYGIVEGAHPVYNYAIYTDNASSPSWPADKLVHLKLNPNTGQTTDFTITANTANTITTSGGMTAVAGVGDPYAIYAQGTSSSLTATILTDNSANWTEDILKGRDLNPNTSQEKLFTIIGNTATTITVIDNPSDMTAVAAGGDIYKAIYDSGTSANLTEAQLTDTITLLFDASKYNLSTRNDNDGDADVHSNNDILFKDGSGWVVDGRVYSAGESTTENWIGNPWRRGKEDNVDPITPPYLDDVTRDYYRERAIAQGNYHPGDATFTDLVQLGGSSSPALIYVEGKVTIGNVEYHRPGNTGRVGTGTIVSGGGDITITGPIEPASGNRTNLALVSFYDTKYKQEDLIVEPPYTEGSIELDIQDDSGTSKLTFDNEYITISFDHGYNGYGFLRGFNYDGTYDSGEIPMNGGARRRDHSYRFHTSALPADDWYYFRVGITRRSWENPDTQARRKALAYFIRGGPSEPQNSIRCYEDSGFTEETSGFDNGGTVYLKIKAKTSFTTISGIQLSNYTLSTWNRSPIGEVNDGTYITCRFTLPSLTTSWWYNLYVTTNDNCHFAKQIYIKPTPSPPDIYACIHSNRFFRLEEEDYTNLNIIGNLTAKHGIKINTTSPISNLRVTYDARTFRRNRRDENALPGAVVFNYTWKEVK
ncbi:MAG: hypothetical protein ABIK53_05340 [bacterium]